MLQTQLKVESKKKVIFNIKLDINELPLANKRLSEKFHYTANWLIFGKKKNYVILNFVVDDISRQLKGFKFGKK